MSTAIDPLEVPVLARIMDELDYYQLLGVEPMATTAEIRKAYHTSSRSFHPDANRGLAQDLLAHCSRISKRVTEAYCVLRDARRRKAYDAMRAEGSEMRIRLAEARSAHLEQRRAEIRGATSQGRQFHAKAESDVKSGNLTSAIQNLLMALTFEPANAGFRSMIEDFKEQQTNAS